ncbi:MAG: ABC transporter ATP-binding protein [Spirochaetales bacterium]
MRELEARRLSFSRQGRGLVLSDISFTLPAGKKLAILGANGAGKTTLLSLLGGRLSPDAGAITLDGESVGTIAPRSLARKIAYLPQIERLPFNYRVLEFVLMGRAPHIQPLSMPGPRDEELARSALAELGLAALEGFRAGEISGGEFQLVRIARCLAQEAELLLLDEPTSLLDPANAQRVARELAALASKGKTIVFATHDIALARSLADFILLLGDHGALRLGPPAEALMPDCLGQAFGVEFGMGQVPTAYSNLA